MALDPSKPFTRRSALAGGVTVTQLAGPRFQKVFHGIYLGADVKMDVAQRARAALLVAPAGSYASHHTAVALWGGWAPSVLETHISTPVPRSRSERRGIVAHPADPTVEPLTHSGVPLAPPTRAFLDLAAARTGIVDLVTVGDSLVRAGVVTPQELVAAADAWRGKGARLARRSAGYVRPGVDSVMESRLRMLILLAGLPEPTVNHIVRAADGTWVWRLDLSYLAWKLAIEYDGRHHAENTRQWNSDIRRREALENAGWRLVVVTAEGIYEAPGETIDRIRTALAQRGCDVPRRRPVPEWKRCFPGRAA